MRAILSLLDGWEGSPKGELESALVQKKQVAVEEMLLSCEVENLIHSPLLLCAYGLCRPLLSETEIKQSP